MFNLFELWFYPMMISIIFTFLSFKMDRLYHNMSINKYYDNEIKEFIITALLLSIIPFINVVMAIVSIVSALYIIILNISKSTFSKRISPLFEKIVKIIL